MRKRRILWLLLAIILLPLSAEGQREIYGVSKYGEFDKRKIHVDETYAMLYEVYEQSTIEGMVRDVVYSMLKACEKEFGNPSTTQCSCKIPFRIDGVSFCADSNGEIIRLSFFASRKAETKKKEARVQRLLRKLRKMRFPPFDRRDIPKARRDNMYINYTALRLKNNVSREDYKFPYPNSSNTSTHLR